MTSKRKKKALIRGMVIGSAVGSAITFLYTPKSGKEVRGNIKDGVDKSLDIAKQRSDIIASEAKKVANDITQKADHLLKISKDYAAGRYKGTSDMFVHEYDRLRIAIRSAVDAYKNYNKVGNTTTDEIIEDIFEEYQDDLSPKHEGMGRRTA